GHFSTPRLRNTPLFPQVRSKKRKAVKNVICVLELKDNALMVGGFHSARLNTNNSLRILRRIAKRRNITVDHHGCKCWEVREALDVETLVGQQPLFRNDISYLLDLTDNVSTLDLGNLA